MKKDKNNITTLEPYQPDLPFFQNNLNHFENIPKISCPFEWFPWFNQLIPRQEWDKRRLKRYIAEFYYSDSDYIVVDVYATSSKVAKKYLNDNYCLISLSQALPDFIGIHGNDFVSDKHKCNKCLEILKEIDSE